MDTWLKSILRVSLMLSFINLQKLLNPEQGIIHTHTPSHLGPIKAGNPTTGMLFFLFLFFLGWGLGEDGGNQRSLRNLTDMWRTCKNPHRQ